jgi:hypothetical protein
MKMSTWQEQEIARNPTARSGCHDVHADMVRRRERCGIEALAGGRDQRDFDALGSSQGRV